MKKIIIVGTTGSGKSTLAKALSKKLDLPYIQLDELFWKKDWQWSSDQEFFSKIEKAIDQPSWIIDGNYSRTNHLTWKDVDTVVWVNFPFWLTFYQNFTRSIKRALSKKELWKGTGNTESFTRMFSKDSILIWLFKTYDSNIKKYETRMNDPQFSHVTFHRLTSRRQVARFLKTA